MRIEITSWTFKKINEKMAYITIEGIDVSETRLEELERNRIDDYNIREVTFVFESNKDIAYLAHWLNSQKAVRDARAKSPKQIPNPKPYTGTRGCISWEEAFEAIRGTITTINSKYKILNPA
jgi:hypothetical protein